MRLAAIDPAGFTDQEKTSRDLLLRKLDRGPGGARSSKSGRCRSTRWAASTRIIPQLVAQLSFTTVKDYDDWIARLHAMPTAFDQVTTNMSIGMRRSARAAEIPARKGAGAGQAAGPAEARRLAAGAAAEEVPCVDSGSRSGAHQDRDAGCDLRKRCCPPTSALRAS